MKKLFVLVFLFKAAFAFSQIIPQSSLYMFNQFAYNPAIAGSKDCYDIKAGYRTQWIGTENNPVNFYANYQNRINRKKVSVQDNYAGYGVNVYSFSNLPLSETVITGAYAFNVRLSRYARLSAGIGAGLMFHRFQPVNLRIRDGGDPLLDPNVAIVLPIVNTGLIYYNRNFYAGISSLQMFANNVNDFGSDQSRLNTNWMFNVGGKVPTKSKYSFLPSVMFRLTNNVPTSVDLHLLADYNNTFAFGLGYRNQDAVMAVFRLKTYKGFSLMYAFDFVNSSLAPIAKNSHEIMLTFSPCDVKKSPLACPVFE